MKIQAAPPGRLLYSVISLLVLFTATGVHADAINFESPPVHPVELSPGGDYLFVAHTADHRLVVYYLGGDEPFRIGEIMVGLEPVTVRARTDNEVWVVNHISDSISIIDILNRNVVRTLVVGDEPTDVVFAGGKAFVSVSQEDLVRVYDLGDLDAAPTDIPLETSDPRSLAVSADGMTVYVTAMDSGNRTTIIPFQTVEAMGGGPAPTPPMNPTLPPPPRPSLIVRHDGTNWKDDAGGIWDAVVPYTMPDNDVIAIGVTSLTVTGSFSDVGTTLFNIAVHPITGDLYVSNQEAFNEIRFEPNLEGKFLHNRVSRIDPGLGSSVAQHLNTHINYAAPDGDATERAMSLAIPLDIAISSGGDIYVTAFGSRKVGVLDAAGNVTRRIDVGEGPGGLAIDEARNRLYVMNRFTSTLSVVDLTDDSSVEISLGFDPSPSEILDGRKFLYDGEISSAHGDLACASCHLFSTFDNIAWDLGNPNGEMIPVPPGQFGPDFHPMKGPMTTQTLRGLQNTEPLHWRGDREDFQDFNVAFVGLMGRTSELPPGDMIAFENFIMTVMYPSNPFRNLDGTLPPSLNGADPIHGEQLFLSGGLVGGLECVSCHTLPTGENGLIIPGGALQEDEGKVVPQLRNMYEKTRFDVTASSTVRGFGFIHDGSVHDLFTFLQFPGFTFNSDADRHDVAAFLLAFDTGTPPAVGAQVTFDGPAAAEDLARLNTLQTQADLSAIGLVAKGRVAGQQRGWVYAGGGNWTPDKLGESDIGQSTLLALAGPGTEVTVTGVVDGCQWRLGVDRDLDTHRDGDERDAGSDPGDPNSTPESTATGIADDRSRVPSALWLAAANPARFETRLGVQVGTPGPAQIEIYDVRGRRVRALLNETRGTGTFFQTWDLRNDRGVSVASGVYFARLQTADASLVKRIAVVR